jgi:hypothetical protein
MGRAGLGALFGADVVAGLQCLRLLRVLPERVASHFNAAGVANGWMSRDGFVGFDAGVVALLSAVFLTLGFVTSRRPVSLINLPNKDHWLAPERKAETLGWLSGLGYWMGAQAVLFIVAVMHVVADVNLGASGEAGRWLPLMVVAFVAATLIEVVWLVLRFRRLE